jgi:hypothetical protein
MIKSRSIRWEGHAARTGEREGGTYRERIHLEDLGIDGRIILKWIFK